MPGPSTSYGPSVRSDRPSFADAPITPTSIQNVTFKEYGFGPFRMAVWAFTAASLTINAGTNGYVAQQLGTFPRGNINISNGVMAFNLSGITGGGGNMQFSVGSTPTADSTLGGTDIDMMAASSASSTLANSRKTAASWHDGTTTAVPIYLNGNTASAATAGVVLVTGNLSICFTNAGYYAS